MFQKLLPQRTTLKVVNERNIALIQVTDTGLDINSETYILRVPALEEIFFHPGRSLTGYPLQKASFRSSRAFFEMIKPIVEQYKPEDRVELVNLTGSLYYYLSGAHAKVFNDPLGQNFIGVKRFPITGQFDEKDKQSFEAVVSYQSLEAPGRICFCGETIATAASLLESLKTYLPWAIERGLEELVIFSICGSKDGAIRLHQFMKSEYPNLKVKYIFCLGLLGLGKDGTALTWNPNNGDAPITLSEYLELGNQVYLPGECAIGDWGLRFKNSSRYLEDWNEERRLLQDI